MNHNTSISRKIFSLFNGIFFLLLMATMILPLWSTLIESLSTVAESMQPGIHLWLSKLSFEGYQTVWVNISLWRPFLNNIFVTVTGTFLHVFICMMAGYVLAKDETPYKGFLTAFVLLTMMLPTQLIIIPIYLVYAKLHLINSLWAIVIEGVASGFSILLIRNYFMSIPKSLEESAYIDGAGEFTIFYKIFIPLSKPGIAAIALFQFVSKWNHYMTAVMFINDTKKYTLQIALKSLIFDSVVTSTTESVAKNARSAGIIIAIIPLVLIYPLAQRYFIKGIMVGSVKE